MTKEKQKSKKKKKSFKFQDGEFTEASAAGDFSVPDSCCKTEKTGCGNTIHPSNIHYTVKKSGYDVIYFKEKINFYIKDQKNSLIFVIFMEYKNLKCSF